MNLKLLRDGYIHMYVVKMLLMKANNRGFYLQKNCLLVFRINLDFLNFTKLLHEKYVKKLVYKEKLFFGW